MACTTRPRPAHAAAPPATSPCARALILCASAYDPALLVLPAARRDKWLVFDLGDVRVVRALSLLGEVNSFAPARVLLDSAPTADGPWRRVDHFRGLGSLRWQRVNLAERPATRFFRLYIRREGHASFRHAVHGCLFHCDKES
eukprot:522688-Prymnesium_polylepis.2